ncbi:hypothetical protein T484DRAFT_1749261 [Baffinella frigidus]|nr:hypothetical protein T484DRAFT_1749261 [Cryptophyta sp. CCMP2293]
MCWRDIVFTADGMILPPSWTAASDSGRGGAIRGALISEEERVLLDLLAQTDSLNDASSVATTPSISRCGSTDMATTPSIRCEAKQPFPVPSATPPSEDVDAGLDSDTKNSDRLND